MVLMLWRSHGDIVCQATLEEGNPKIIYPVEIANSIRPATRFGLASCVFAELSEPFLRADREFIEFAHGKLNDCSAKYISIKVNSFHLSLGLPGSHV